MVGLEWEGNGVGGGWLGGGCLVRFIPLVLNYWFLDLVGNIWKLFCCGWIVRFQNINVWILYVSWLINYIMFFLFSIYNIVYIIIIISIIYYSIYINYDEIFPTSVFLPSNFSELELTSYRYIITYLPKLLMQYLYLCNEDI